MRFQFSPLTGNSYDTALLFLRRSVTTRLLAVGLPGVALLLLCLIAFVSRNTGTAITAALERNAQLRAGSVSLILEQIFTETRNQLLILAAGPVSRQTMDDRLRFRAKAGGVHYREVAFMARNSDDSFLLINHDGEIVTVPIDMARQAIGSPFNMGEIRHTANHVHMGQPLEVIYPPLPFKGAMQSPRLQVLRFSTPIFDDNDQYLGLLILSLDLSVLRDAISMFSSSESSFWQNSNLSHVRSVFFDVQGWMIFQSEKNRQGTVPLSLNEIRKGFGGDFGRPGFSTAFRPYPRHLRWWEMVEAVQKGKSGRISISSRDEGWSDTAFSDVHASYAPIFFSSAPDAVPDVIGGIAVLDGMPSDVGGIYLFWTLCTGASLCLLFMGLLLWRTGRVTDRALARFADEIDATAETSATAIPELPNAPHTLNRARNSVNRLLRRLRRAEDVHNSWHDQQQTLWEREACDLMPENVAAPFGLVGESPVMNELREHIARAAPSDADILVIGETGTGKELVSRAIHEASPRRDGPFITINCGALDENLLMDTLFGHVKGAFTEARQPRKGAFLAAEGGTLMLDEVGNASPKVQQALLRALSTRAMRPLGSDEEVPFNTRIIAATNALLPRDENFREDLFYRLAVITIQTPPLRDRREDLPALASYFLSHEAAARNVPVPAVSRGALNLLMECGWPGNVRQLRNCLIRALAFCENGIIQAENIQLEILPLQNDDLPAAPAANGGTAATPPENPASPPLQDGEHTEEPADGDLPPRIAAVLPHMAAAGRVSRQEYQELAGENISMRTAQYDLQLLQKLGLVEKQGRGPAQRYVLTPEGEARARRCQHKEE